jgi:hypothetical protein
LTLRTRKTDKPRRRLTEAQQAANARSFRIFRLRGLYSFAALLSPARAAVMRGLIDDELQSLGAMSQTAREAVIRDALARADERERQREEMFAELPF